MSQRRQQQKYKRAKKSLDYNGVKYASQFEINIRKTLDNAFKNFKNNKRQTFEFDYETEIVPYVLYKNYTPDWPITRPDGTTIYVESKGLFDQDARAKMLAVKDQHPDKTFVLLFQQNNSISRGSKTRYSDWAEQHGFDYSVGCIPIRWLFGEFCPKTKLNEVINIV